MSLRLQWVLACLTEAGSAHRPVELCELYNCGAAPSRVKVVLVLGHTRYFVWCSTSMLRIRTFAIKFVSIGLGDRLFVMALFESRSRVHNSNIRAVGNNLSSSCRGVPDK